MRGQGAVEVTPQDEALVGQRERERDHEHDHRDRARIAELEALEAPVDHVDRHRVRRVHRAAAGHHPHEVEELQRADDAQEDRDADGRAEQRERHVAEHLPAGRAVDDRGLFQLARDLLQAGEVEDHVEAEVLPGDGHEHRVEHDAGVGEPFLLPRQDAVREPAGLQHQREDDAGDHLGEHERREVQDAQERPALDARVEHQRDTERERQLQREREDDEDAVVPQRAREHVVAEGAPEVLEPDEVVEVREPVPLEAAVVDRLQDGRDDQQPVEHERGREEQRDGGPPPPGTRAACPADGDGEDPGDRGAIRPWRHPRSCRRRPAARPCPRRAPAPRR